MGKYVYNELQHIKIIKKLLKSQVKTIEDAKEFERNFGVKVRIFSRNGKTKFGIYGVGKSSFSLSKDIKLIQVKIDADDYDFMLKLYGGDNTGNRQRFSLYLRQIIAQEIDSLRNQKELNEKFEKLFEKAVNLELEQTENNKKKEEDPDSDLPVFEKEEDIIYDELYDEEDKLDNDYGW